MDARMQRRVQRYGWDRAAEAYEPGWKHSLADAHTETLRLAAARPGEQALDLACGTGLISLPLCAAVGPDGQVTATDLSDEMVAAVRRNAATRGFANLRAFRADAESFPTVADNSIDLVTCALGLMYMPDPARSATESLRVLRPGGRAVMAVWGERSKCGWADIFPIVDARVKSTVCPLFFRLGTGPALQHLLQDVGFTGVRTVRLSCTLPYPDEDSALEAAFVGGPVALAYNRFDASTRAAAHAEYLASIARYRTPQGYRIPGEFVVCKGIKPGG